MINELPEPSKTNYPHTFRKYAYCDAEERNAWFATIFGLIALCEQQMREDSIPCPQFTTEQLDALSLDRDEWAKTISDPERVELLYSGVFQVGLGRLMARGTSTERNNWVDTLQFCCKGAGWVFFGSVGGNAITKLMGEVGNRSSK